MSRRWRLRTMLALVVVMGGCGLAAVAGARRESSPQENKFVAPAVRDRNLPSGVQARLKQLGLTVDWPVAIHAHNVASGTALTVTIAGTDTKALSVTGRVTLSQLTAGGRRTLASVPLGSVAGERLGTWSLRALIPGGVGTRYALALTAGKVHYTSELRGSGAVHGTGAGATGLAARIALSPSHTVPGESAAFTVTNTGADALHISDLAWQERSTDGAWVPYSYGPTCCAHMICPEFIAVAVTAWSVTLGPGDSASTTTVVPPATASGSFRLALNDTGSSTDSAERIALTSQATQVTATDRCGTETSPVVREPTVTVTTATTPTRTTGPIRPLRR